jgi:sugar lactone lactonase YvrE
MYASKDKLYFADVSNHRIRAIDFASGNIDTVAGGGSEDIGDGLDARLATFSTHPMRVALDIGGNLYVTDAHQDRVRRVDISSGIISTVAGNGVSGYGGDGGPATEASLAVPHATRLNRQGNFYIADTHNHRIRRVDGGTGVITTIAGTGEVGFSGDDIAAVDAKLSSPLSVEVDEQGNVYIVDMDNLRIRRVDGSTGIITTVAGNGEKGLGGDGVLALETKFTRLRDVFIGHDGYMYIVDSGNAQVYRLDFASGLIHVVAGCGENGYSGDGGAATRAHLHSPYNAALDREGNLFIADTNNKRVRRVDAASGEISTVAGTGEQGFAGDGGPAVAALLG